MRIPLHLSKEQAARMYERLADDLNILHSRAANYISRVDNNWQFEAAVSLRAIAERIRCEYDVIYTEGGGPHRRRGEQGNDTD